MSLEPPKSIPPEDITENIPNEFNTVASAPSDFVLTSTPTAAQHEESD